MMRRGDFLPLIAAVLLVIVPLLLPLVVGPAGKAEFGGTDEQARDLITALRPDYKPWCRPLWLPPSSEIDSLLFALQAAIGAGVIGYYAGLVRGRAGTRSVEGGTRDAAG